MHIASLEANTTLNTYSLWKLGYMCLMIPVPERGIELGTF